VISLAKQPARIAGGHRGRIDYTAFVFSSGNAAFTKRPVYSGWLMGEGTGGNGHAARDAVNPLEEESGPGAALEWPAHFPDKCPPTDALDLNHNVFLLVATDPPTGADTQCAIDRRSFKQKPACLRASISCRLTASDAEELRRAIPRLRSFLISSAALEPRHGKIKQTGDDPAHYSMWLRASVLPSAHTLFRVSS
jgi:hypothetical protein